VYDGMLLEGAIQEYEDAFNAVDDSGNGSIGEGAHTACGRMCWKTL
jgi:Ca2+-binding EF-hand superfamily protein